MGLIGAVGVYDFDGRWVGGWGMIDYMAADSAEE